MSSNPKKEKNIQVYVRCRPLNASEKKCMSPSVIDVEPQSREVIVKERLGDKELSKKFTFDKVFGPESTQIEVYKNVVSHLIEEVLMGYNCTVFAYGQTGTGKTHTMIGAKTSGNLTWEDDPGAGIIPRTLHNLYEALNQLEVEFSVKVSFLELYNEELFDLLAPVPDGSKLRMLKDNGKMGTGTIWVQGLEEKIVHNREEVYAILEKGTERRRVGSTLMNDQSSRSHTVFTVTIHIKESNIDGEDLLKIGKLNLVDLAGSECIGRSGAVDRRAREAGNINQSLLTLGRVITALVEKAPHVPYRESKLTRLLQDSLGGRTKTSIIATISPAAINLEETLSTLDYAHRAKNIMNKPEINQKLTKKAVMREYVDEIERLRKDLVASRDKNGVFLDLENYEYMQNKIAGLSSEVKEKLANIDSLKEQMLHVEDMFKMTKIELTQKERQLNHTTRVLNQTKSDLSEKILELNSTLIEKDEQIFLVNHRAKIESQLTEQAQKLVNVVEVATNDVQQLHSKIERKTLVEKTNESHSKSFQSQLNANLLAIENSTAETYDKQETLIKELESDLSVKIAAQLHTLGNQINMLQQLKDCVMNDVSTAQNQMESHYDYVSEFGKNRTIKNQQYMESLLMSHQEFRDQKAHTLFLKMADLIANQSQIIQEQSQLFLQNAKNMSLISLNHVEEVKSQISLLKSSAERMSLENSAKYNHMADKLQNVEQERTVLLSKWQKQREMILAATMETDSLMNSHENTLRDNIPQVLKTTEEMRVGDIQYTKATLESCDALSHKTSIMASDCEDSINKSCAIVTTMVANFEENQEICKANYQEFQKVIADNFDNIQMVSDEFQQNVLGEIDNLNKQSNLFQSSTLSTLNVLTEAVSSKTEELDNVTRQSQIKLGEMTVKQSSSHNSILESVAEGKQYLASALQQCKEIVEKFVNEEIVKDISTGQTPQRKDYVFSQELAATSPHERILGRLRQQLSLDKAVDFVLPDDIECFEEIPLHKTSSQININNLTSLQDSNASSTSLDSNFSLKQDLKENVIKKPRPIPVKCVKSSAKAPRKILTAQNVPTSKTPSPNLKPKFK